MGFCILPALVGVFIIFFSILASFSTVVGIYMKPSWVFLWVFLGMVLISHTIVTVSRRRTPDRISKTVVSNRYKI
jgi:hypothetical protein